MKISSIGELKLIQHISEILQQQLPETILGIGDDCAIIPQTEDRSILVTTDLLIEGIHFLKAATSPQDLGHKSLAVNLSDIAAMGGIPTYAFLSIALPKDTELQWVDGFYAGFRDLAKTHGVYVLGGDTTQSLSALSINVTLLGEIKPGQAKLRSSAKPGDLICVTGFLGDSAGGLKTILEAPSTDSTELQYLLHRHHHPEPHIRPGRWLAEHEEVHAMMDVSDGIDSDLRRILERSTCGAQIQLEKLPISEPLLLCAQEFNWDILELATTGGEDYCLLLTVDRTSQPKIANAFKDQFNFVLTVIGEITTEKGELTYTLHGQPHTFSKSGFDHFSHKTEEKI